MVCGGPNVPSHDTFVRDEVLTAETFVPSHIHPTQDERIVVLAGNPEIEFSGDVLNAGPGDTVRMPKGQAHGIFNRSRAAAKCTIGVVPSRKLSDLFVKLVGVADPEELARLSALHEVDFLPSPEAA